MRVIHQHGQLRAGAHRYTFLESVDLPTGLQGIDEVMETLIALPDRLHARLAVALAGSEATELGQPPHRLAGRRRDLRRVIE
jgi:hypothetical protein